MSPNSATLAMTFQQEVITLPGSATPATLRSILQGVIGRRRGNVLQVKLALLSGDARWGEDAAKCLIPIPAASGFDEPIQGPAILDAFFSSAAVGTITAHVVLYLGNTP